MVAVEQRVAGVPGSFTRVRSLSASWEAALAIPMALACVASRVVNLDRYSGSYPEGIRAAQLQLMAAGYRPFADIFSDQGPWLLQALYPGYLLFGGSLVGVRAGVVVGSLVGLAGVYWIARQLGGPLAALAALLLLALSPIYLQFSRLAVAEVLALGPAIVAVGCAVRFMRSRRPGWLYAAGALLAVSLLIKPITLGTAAPVGLAVWLAGGRRWRNVVLVGLTTGLVLLVGVLLAGLPEILQQIVQFRLASREAEGWSLAGNVRRLRAELRVEGLALPLLAAGGAILAARDRRGWPLLAWAGAALGTILAHSPLHSKHFAIVVVPLALLAAYGVGTFARMLTATTSGRSLLVGGGLLCGSLVLWFASVPRIASEDWRLLTSDDLFERDEARPWYGEAAATLAAVVRPGEFVVTDHAYLAYTAGRLIPPGLVEASATRVRAGSLTDGMAIDASRSHYVRAVLLWADKLDDLKGYRRWLTEHFVPAKVWAAEGETRPVLWLRNDGRLDGDREALRAQVGSAPSPRSFGPWRLMAGALGSDRSTRLEAAPAACGGAAVWSVLEWERAGQTTADYMVRVSTAVEPSGASRDHEERLLSVTGRPEWLFWVGAVPRTDVAGSHRVSVALLDGRGRPLASPEVIGRLDVGSC